MKVEAGDSELYRQFEILVCTRENVFTGIIRCEYGQRLIDALNEGVPVGASSRGVDFLALEDVKLRDMAGTEAAHPRLYIAKHNIVFIAQHERDKAEKPLNAYPYRQKVPVKVKIYEAPFMITGQVYSDTWEQLADTIEAQVKFMPLTNVEVTPALPGGYSHFEFAAINKENVTYLSENITGL
ncbi:MAG: hypothetical protein PHO26_07965 [Dehalococcoidia bacterium]|nr:hypothetical protein [Dehalococcoidia bacterium]MDD5493963.1 hypothetical protein [Dehalococcoidia bacterium]